VCLIEGGNGEVAGRGVGGEEKTRPKVESATITPEAAKVPACEPLDGLITWPSSE
jgi:hypothetical protein